MKRILIALTALSLGTLAQAGESRTYLEPDLKPKPEVAVKLEVSPDNDSVTVTGPCVTVTISGLAAGGPVELKITPAKQPGACKAVNWI